MTGMISQRELRNNSGEVMRALDAGEEFVVTRNGVPVGRLTPIRRTFVARERLIDGMRGAAVVDLGRLRTDLDAVVDQDPTPRA